MNKLKQFYDNNRDDIKSSLTLVVISFVIVAIGGFGAQIYQNYRQSQSPYQTLSTKMLDQTFDDQTKTEFQSNDLTVFQVYKPNCQACQETRQTIMKNINDKTQNDHKVISYHQIPYDSELGQTLLAQAQVTTTPLVITINKQCQIKYVHENNAYQIDHVINSNF